MYLNLRYELIPPLLRRLGVSLGILLLKYWFHYASSDPKAMRLSLCGLQIPLAASQSMHNAATEKLLAGAFFCPSLPSVEPSEKI
jgi:hypothetical protein